MPYKDEEKQKEYKKQWYLDHKEEIQERLIKYNQKSEVKKAKREWAYKNGINKPMNENKECSYFLGVYIAENILSKVFENVKRMKTNNPGFDFICNKGYKIDVKSSTLRSGAKNLRWNFDIKRNKIPDYFLLLGFDNRNDLNPLKFWLVPGNKINNKGAINITNTHGILQKWKQYELEEKLEKVILCCNTMKKSGGLKT